MLELSPNFFLEFGPTAEDRIYGLWGRVNSHLPEERKPRKAIDKVIAVAIKIDEYIGDGVPLNIKNDVRTAVFAVLIRDRSSDYSGKKSENYGTWKMAGAIAKTGIVQELLSQEKTLA